MGLAPLSDHAKSADDNPAWIRWFLAWVRAHGRRFYDFDGLTDAQIPMVVRCGGTVIGQLTGETHPTLAERRNALAHGDPFDGLPTGGLLELVRDLINYAYRHYVAEANSLPPVVQPVALNDMEAGYGEF